MLVQGLLSSLFPDIVFSLRGEEKAVYLTFDDGPAELTPWVLKELNKYNAKATFFCVGSNVQKDFSTFNKIIENGHSVGNHTARHMNGWKTSTKKYLDDIEECNSILYPLQPQTSNLKPQTKLFRPPYGKISLSQYYALRESYRIVMWDVLSKDYDKNISPEQCLERIITKSRPGSVVVFHDTSKAERNLRYALPRALEYFSEKNFSFLPLPH